MAESVVLAIETSQRSGGAALRGRDGAVYVEALSARVRHDEQLMPAIDGLFKQAGLARRDLSAVGVSIGPGGFTGLRIGVSTAKMVAMSLGASVVAVPTALVVAEGCVSDLAGEGPIVVALASKGDTVWATRLARREGAWRIEGAPGLVRAEELSLEGLTVLIGDAYLPEALRARCGSREGGRIEVLGPVFDPRSCLQVAERLLREGETTDAYRLSPMYAREPEAVRLWEDRERRERGGTGGGGGNHEEDEAVQ